MNIKLSLIKSLIIESVKNETYQKGIFDKATDANTAAAYHEQAGDEEYHERMLSRAFYTNLEELKSYLGDYLTSNGATTADNICSEEKDDVVAIMLTVSERFNTSYTDTLSKLSAKYIEESMLADWWKPINADRTGFYAQCAEKDLAAIRRCFVKTAPKAPTYQFPTAITIHYPVLPERDGVPGILSSADTAHKDLDPMLLHNNPWCLSRGDESAISYTLTGENAQQQPVDDIVVRCDDPCCRAALDTDGLWQLRGLRSGYTIVTLFSRHNDQVFAKFAVQVTD